MTCGVMLALAACASPQKPPSISYDSGDFAPATIETAPLAPVRIVKLPVPLPLPGQLKPVEEQSAPEPDDVDPARRVDAANAAARMEPARDGYINAIQVYPFSQGALYRLYTAPEQVSDIALQVGEKLLSVSAGDTVRWVIGDTESGHGETSRVHILVKPTEADLKTNLVITTDRRAYHLEMESFESTYMASLSWRYPHDELVSLRRQSKQAQAIQERIIDTGISLDRLQFRYVVTGDKPPWRPMRVFDDGQKVYIEFPHGIAQGDAPPLFVVGPEGDNELVNYRMKGRYYVVDKLFAAAELRLGADPQQVVRISRTDGRTNNGTARSSALKDNADDR
ncbi:MAG: P-type conjugative transfer protein TrbG [Rhizobiaceae bacterium]|nr:P-type conjugative transfer protein TrbG [Rhizobiaceae bacterium]